MNYTEKVIKVVEHTEVERFINEHFKFEDPFDCMAADDLDTDSLFQVSVTGNMKPWEEDEVREVIEFQEWGCCSASLLLNALCKEGKLEPGEYFIHTTWGEKA